MLKLSQKISQKKLHLKSNYARSKSERFKFARIMPNILSEKSLYRYKPGALFT